MKKVVRSIDLTGTQLKNLKGLLRKQHNSQERLSTLVMDILNQFDDENQEMWNWIAQQFEYDTLDDCEEDGYTLKISWVNNQLQLTELKDNS